MPAIEFDDSGRHPVQKGPVVGNCDNAALEFNQQILQPLDRFEIEMVGWLIEQKNVGLRNQSLGQRHPLAGAAGQSAYKRVTIKMQSFHCLHYTLLPVPAVLRFDCVLQCTQIPLSQAIRIHQRDRFRHADADNLKYSCIHVERRLLGYIGDAQVLLYLYRAIIRLFKPGKNFQQRGFAGAVTTNQTDAFAGFKRKIGPVEQCNMAEGQLRIEKSDECHIARNYLAERRVPMRHCAGPPGICPDQCGFS